MDDLAHVIFAILKKSDLIVVKDLQEGFDTDPDLSVETFRSWLDNLEDMQEKAEKFEEVEAAITSCLEKINEPNSLHFFTSKINKSFDDSKKIIFYAFHIP